MDTIKHEQEHPQICPVLVAESERFTIYLLLECPSETSLRCNLPEGIDDIIDQVLSGTLDPLDVSPEIRPLLLSLLYGGILLLYKSKRYGPVPLSRYQLPASLTPSAAKGAADNFDDDDILEVWASILYKDILPEATVRPRLLLKRDGGPCRVAPTGVRATR